MDKAKALNHRLWQAERALHNWPSDKNMDRVFFIRREIKRLNNPTTPAKWNLATAIWPPVAASN